MKKIIIPVDFSQNSLNALSFAAELASRASARLIILHVLQNDDERNAFDKLKSLEAEVKNKFKGEIDCETSLLQGKLIEKIKQAVALHQPELIVMGTKGASGLKEIFIGSNTVNVIKKINRPLLVIPDVATFKNMMAPSREKIVLATDLEELGSPDTLTMLKEIALILQEKKIRVLSVRPPNSPLPDLKKLERDRLLTFFSPELKGKRITVFSDDVISGINFYLKKNDDVALFAMIAKDSGALIGKHHTREMASHTFLPLLILQDVKNW